MEVLEHDDEWLTVAQSSQELADRLEQEPVVSPLGRHQVPGLCHLGEEPGELGAPDRREVLDHLRLPPDAAIPEGRHPWGEREDPLQLPRPPEEHSAVQAGGLAGQLGHEPALADAGFAEDHHEPAPTNPDGLARVAQAAQLALPADERRVRGREEPVRKGGHIRGRSERRTAYGLECRPSRLGDGRGRLGRDGAHVTLLEDLLMELPGRRLWLHSQLLLKHSHAPLVLVEGCRAAPEVGVEPHDGPVDGLLKWIQCRQAQRRLKRRLGRSRAALVGKEPRQPLESQLSQPLPLKHEPFLKGGFLDGQSLEEVALVETRRLGECGRGAVGHTVLEAGDVHIDGSGVEGEGAPVEMKPGRGLVGQGLAENEERLAQALPRLVLGPVTPEEGGHLVPRVRLAERHGEVREHGLGLAGRQRQRRSRIQPGAEASEESEADECHEPLRGYAGTNDSTLGRGTTGVLEFCDAPGDGLLTHAW